MRPSPPSLLQHSTLHRAPIPPILSDRSPRRPPSRSRARVAQGQGAHPQRRVGARSVHACSSGARAGQPHAFRAERALARGTTARPGGCSARARGLCGAALSAVASSATRGGSCRGPPAPHAAGARACAWHNECGQRALQRRGSGWAGEMALALALEGSSGGTCSRRVGPPPRVCWAAGGVRWGKPTWRAVNTHPPALKFPCTQAPRLQPLDACNRGCWLRIGVGCATGGPRAAPMRARPGAHPSAAQLTPGRPCTCL
jgi:hypothetical protein